MAFNLFGFKGSPSKAEDKQKSEDLGIKPAQPQKLSFEEALARQIQSKAEQAAALESVESTPQPAPKGEIIFEKAPATEPIVVPTEVAPLQTKAVEQPTSVGPPEQVNAAQTQPPEPAASPTPQQAQPSEIAPQGETPALPLIAATREDVIAAYKIFLDRLPESEEVITPRIGLARERILSSFMTSKYFLSRPKNIQLLLLTAIQIEQKVSA